MRPTSSFSRSMTRAQVGRPSAARVGALSLPFSRLVERPVGRRVPLRVGRYVAIELLGMGGMGVVYRALDRESGGEVALKLLPGEVLDSRLRERFGREIRQTARLAHPNTVRVLDHGEAPDGGLYYAMELVRGLDLSRIVKTYGPLPATRVVHLVRQAAEALGEAHALGIVHRDVKPPNLLVACSSPVPDFVKVVDFGLVKDLAGREAAVTLDGMVLGTPGFLPVEAIDRPGSVDARSDVYMLGAVAYYLLTGSRPYDLGTRSRTWLEAMREQPPRPSVRIGAPVPADLEDLVMRCLERDPSARPTDGRELALALQDLSLANAWSPQDAHRFWLLHDGPCARA